MVGILRQLDGGNVEVENVTLLSRVWPVTGIQTPYPGKLKSCADSSFSFGK